eukprot:gb/GECG01012165.1/.p1 GENE.gb/GECG01012165.1/~~gb/GECG01012165.1/.p1  ORF type:complete len:278 (+),score=49.78 gb/GECG01012165.1/:1-834(+)
MERILEFPYRESLQKAVESTVFYCQQASPLPEIALGGMVIGLVSIAIVQTYSSQPWVEWWRTDLDEAQEEMEKNLSSRKKHDVSSVDDKRDPETAESIDSHAAANAPSKGTAHRRKGDGDHGGLEATTEEEQTTVDTASSVNELTEHERQELGISKKEEERLREYMKLTVNNPEDAKKEVAKTLRSIIEHVKSGRSMEDLLDVPLHQRILRFLGRRIDLIVICSFIITALVVLFVNDPDTLSKVIRYMFPKESTAILETIRRFREDAMNALDSKVEL